MQCLRLTSPPPILKNKEPRGLQTMQVIVFSKKNSEIACAFGYNDKKDSKHHAKMVISLRKAHFQQVGHHR